MANLANDESSRDKMNEARLMAKRSLHSPEIGESLYDFLVYRPRDSDSGQPECEKGEISPGFEMCTERQSWFGLDMSSIFNIIGRDWVLGPWDLCH